MKFTSLILLLMMISGAIQAQALCNNGPHGFIPLNDLGTGFYQGVQGGLYPAGSNIRPQEHTNAGLTFASTITPLDINGNPDSVDGKIVLLGVGMSNTRLEYEEFESIVDTFQNRSRYLEAITVAQNGQDINIIIDSTAQYWDNIDLKLSEKGVSRAQVQAMWFKQADAYPTDTNFVSYIDTLKNRLKIALNILHDRFPNAKLCYISSRIYGGYGTIELNPEPYAYRTGFAVKRLIEDQLNGDPKLAYEGAAAKSPWISWGPYTWADGPTPRSDGLTWNCPEDFKRDGTHPSELGSTKVAQQLLKFFSTDETSRSWFLENVPLAIPSDDVLPEDFRIDVKNYPNPFNGNTIFSIKVRQTAAVSLKIFDLRGRQVATLLDQQAMTAGDHQISWTPRLASGIYFYRIEGAGQTLTRKLLLQK